MRQSSSALLPTRSLSGCLRASIWAWRKASVVGANKAATMAVAARKMPGGLRKGSTALILVGRKAVLRPGPICLRPLNHTFSCDGFKMIEVLCVVCSPSFLQSTEGLLTDMDMFADPGRMDCFRMNVITVPLSFTFYKLLLCTYVCTRSLQSTQDNNVLPIMPGKRLSSAFHD